jgi:hypothetical protein
MATQYDKRGPELESSPKITPEKYFVYGCLLVIMRNANELKHIAVLTGNLGRTAPARTEFTRFDYFNIYRGTKEPMQRSRHCTDHKMQ